MCWDVAVYWNRWRMLRVGRARTVVLALAALVQEVSAEACEAKNADGDYFGRCFEAVSVRPSSPTRTLFLPFLPHHGWHGRCYKAVLRPELDT
jgi:hypothetical protein